MPLAVFDVMNSAPAMGGTSTLDVANSSLYTPSLRRPDVDRSAKATCPPCSRIFNHTRGHEAAYRAAGVCLYHVRDPGSTPYILLVQQKGKWTLPGGKRARANKNVYSETSSAATAAREVEEETHWQLRAVDLQPLLESSPACYDRSGAYVAYFVHLEDSELPQRIVGQIKAGLLHPDAQKCLDAAWVPLAHLPRYKQMGMGHQAMPRKWCTFMLQLLGKLPQLYSWMQQQATLQQQQKQHCHVQEHPSIHQSAPSGSAGHNKQQQQPQRTGTRVLHLEDLEQQLQGLAIEAAATASTAEGGFGPAHTPGRVAGGKQVGWQRNEATIGDDTPARLAETVAASVLVSPVPHAATAPVSRQLPDRIPGMLPVGEVSIAATVSEDTADSFTFCKPSNTTVGMLADARCELDSGTNPVMGSSTVGTTAHPASSTTSGINQQGAIVSTAAEMARPQPQTPTFQPRFLGTSGAANGTCGNSGSFGTTQPKHQPQTPTFQPHFLGTSRPHSDSSDNGITSDSRHIPASQADAATPFATANQHTSYGSAPTYNPAGSGWHDNKPQPQTPTMEPRLLGGLLAARTNSVQASAQQQHRGTEQGRGLSNGLPSQAPAAANLTWQQQEHGWRSKPPSSQATRYPPPQQQQQQQQ